MTDRRETLLLMLPGLALLVLAFVLPILRMLVLSIAGPELILRSAGADLVVLVDRSRSMPAGAEARAEELIRLLEPQRRPGDRVGVISFGRAPKVELPLSKSVQSLSAGEGQFRHW